MNSLTGDVNYIEELKYKEERSVELECGIPYYCKIGLMGHIPPVIVEIQYEGHNNIIVYCSFSDMPLLI